MKLDKDKRYDRQLRLWGDHGQAALENAKVCLIRASATGTEILKNLILPGIGSFVVVDDAIVTEEDLGNNFFVGVNHIGKPKSQVVTESLSELNDDVNGSFITENAIDLIENDPTFFLGFTVIIVTDAREGSLLRLSRLLAGTPISLVVCISVGVIGYLRVSTMEHVIVESHPDAQKPDLRLDRPLLGLIQIASETALEDMSAEQLSHTPWLIILHIFIEKFKEKHGHFPMNHKEKAELRKMISSAASDLMERLQQSEKVLEPSFTLENFQEAAQSVNVAVCPTEIPPEVQQILEDTRSDDASFLNCRPTVSLNTPSSETFSLHEQSGSDGDCSFLSSATFWRLATALRDFVDNEGDGQLPVRGSLPDMTSDSVRYLRLLSIYQEAFEWGVERIAARLSQTDDINMNKVRLFVRNAAFLRVVRCRSLEEEMKLSPARSEDLALLPTHQENDAMTWYLVLRGACSFLMENGRWPGSVYPYSVTNYTKAVSHDSAKSVSETAGDRQENCIIASKPSVTDPVNTDLPLFSAHLSRVLRAYGIPSDRVSMDFLQEMCRFGGGELHSVAAFMGGIAAQEVIKLITHQFVPVTQTLMYNAITQRTELLQF